MATITNNSFLPTVTPGFTDKESHKQSSEKKKRRKSEWTKERDASLKKLVEGFGTSTSSEGHTIFKPLGKSVWTWIAERLAEACPKVQSITGSQCEWRYNNHLRPGLSKQPLTYEQQKTIGALYKNGVKPNVIYHQFSTHPRGEIMVFLQRFRDQYRDEMEIISNQAKKRRKIEEEVIVRVPSPSHSTPPSHSIESSEASSEKRLADIALPFFSSPEIIIYKGESIEPDPILRNQIESNGIIPFIPGRDENDLPPYLSEQLQPLEHDLPPLLPPAPLVLGPT